LFEILKRIFDDAKVDQAELRAFGFILKGIGLQCSGTSALAGGEMPDDGFLPETELKHIGIGLPSLEYVLTVANTDGSASQHVDLVNQLYGLSSWLPGLHVQTHAIRSFRISQRGTNEKFQRAWSIRPGDEPPCRHRSSG
jgi:hypothetical protein